MRRVTAWFVALSLPLLLLGGPAVAQKKAEKDKDLDKPVDKWIKSGEVVGKVTNVYEDKKRIRIQVNVTTPKLNVGALQQMQQAQVNYANAAARRDINGMAQARQQMAQVQLYTMDRQTQDIEIQAIDDVVVRNNLPKQEFDDKGKLKKLTRAEIAKQKGDSKQPGYTAEFSDLQTEQIIKCTLVRKKGTAAPKVVRPKKGKDKDKDLDVGGDALDDNTLQTNMIIILYTPMPK